MNEIEFLQIMQSDSKLWDYAETVQDGGAVTKTLQVPWGIGEVSVTLEGMGDVNGRRAAFSAFGEYIRGLVNDRISEEAITARAEQADKRTGATSDRQPDSTSPSPEESAEILSKEAVEAHDGPSTYSADPSIRLVELRAASDRAKAFIESTETEVRALEAYMEIINAEKE